MKQPSKKWMEEISEQDKKEIKNLIDFKKRYKKWLTSK